MLKRDLYYERIPTKSLRDDVRYLGNILGRVIKKQEGENFFNLVEKIRLLSKANKKNKNDKLRFKKIIYEIQKLSPKNIFKLSRAFNHFMNFINLSETIDGSLAILKNPEISIDELVTIIPGPDFPTGGIINGKAGAIEAAKTGRGKVVLRAKVEIEKRKKWKK